MRDATPLRHAAAAAAILMLAGCASVDIDRAVGDTNAAVPAFTGGRLELARNAQQRQQREQLAASLLAQPVSMEGAVQLALANSPAVQALVAEGWGDMATAAQGGRLANPLFSFERMRLGSELEIGRLLSVGLVDLLMLPQRQGIARAQLAQARTALALRVVEQVSAVRQSWVRAVAAQQALAYAQQVQQAAEASAELARRMQQVGNFSRLQRARHHAFYAEATAQLATATQARLAAREDLVRRLGLTPAQAEQLTLPERLPDLPAQERAPQELTRAALEQRLDVQQARLQLDAAGRAQGLKLLDTLVDVELGVRHDTVFDNATGSRQDRNGYEADIRLPLFDWGDARRAALDAQSLAAANRYDAVARDAASQLRESYSAYRTAYGLARHYRDELVPLRRTISEENQLRYNGMLIGVFELLADAREQVATVRAALDAQERFWLADAALSSTLVGRPIAAPGGPVSAAPTGGDAAAH